MSTNTTWYRAGSASLTHGAGAVVGVGCLWLSQVSPGDLFATADADGVVSSSFYEIESVTSDLLITLKAAWAAGSVSSSGYVVVRNFTGTLPSDLAARLSRLMASYEVSIDQLITFMTSSGPVSLTALNGQTITTVGMLDLSGAVSGDMAAVISAQQSATSASANASAASQSAARSESNANLAKGYSDLAAAYLQQMTSTTGSGTNTSSVTDAQIVEINIAIAANAERQAVTNAIHAAAIAQIQSAIAPQLIFP